MKASALAPANIAFIKYWGRLDHDLFLPLSTTNSMNLSACLAHTTVEFSSSFAQDEIVVRDSSGSEKRLLADDGEKSSGLFCTLDRARQLSEIDLKARAYSTLTFPISAGIASSAAGLCAFVAASFSALGLSQKVDDREELSREVRLSGSVSAARSTHDGFTEHLFGENHQQAVTRQILSANGWDLVDIVAVVSSSEKKISSALGHRLADTSPLMEGRKRYLPDKAEQLREALLQRDFDTLSLLSEQDTLNMHAVMMTSRPSALYFQPGTIELIHAVKSWREDGVPVFFTIDAGPNVHVIAPQASASEVSKRLKSCASVEFVLENTVGDGVRIIDEHLF